MKKYFTLNNLVNHKKESVAVLVALILSFTPFYGVAYIIAIVFGVRTLTFSKTFSTVFGRIVLSVLFLAVTIMITGLASWLIDIRLYSTFVIVAFGLLLLIFSSYNYNPSSSSKFIGSSDIISLGVAFVAPLIAFISFQLPNPSHAATYQFLNSGWDNSSHLLMLETASNEKGYVYGNYSHVRDKTIQKFNAYPQAWHLATSNIANGFGVNLFNQERQILTMNAYITVLLAWYITAAYAFSKLSWRILKSLRNKATTPTRATVTLFITATLFIQLVALWSSLTVGFANYIGCIAYLIVFTAMIVDTRKDDRRSQYLAALIAGAGASLSWFLPLPAIALAALLVFANTKMTYKFSNMKKLLLNSVPLTLATIITSGAVLMQIAIFVVYSHVTGADQLNAGTIGGAFDVSQLLLAVIAILGFLFYIKNRSTISRLTEKQLSILSAFLILTFAIYTYQLLTSGEVSYYFGKAMGLTFIVAGIFFVPAFVYTLSKIYIARPSLLSSVIIGLSSIGILIIGTNQSTESLNKLFQRSSLITYPTAVEAIRYVKSHDPNHAKFVILRHKSTAEDYNGNLAAKLPHLPLTCAYSVVNAESKNSLKTKIEKLDACAETLDKKILVITSNETKKLVKELGHNNIEIVNVP